MGEKVNYFELSASEEKTVKEFLLQTHKVPLSFWGDKRLLKRVNSVWIVSKEANQLLHLVRCESAGLLLFLELKTLKLSRQGEAFLENTR